MRLYLVDRRGKGASKMLYPANIEVNGATYHWAVLHLWFCRYCGRQFKGDKGYISDDSDHCMCVNCLAYIQTLPKGAEHIPGAQGSILGCTELCLHTRTNGKQIWTLWKHPSEEYGYAILTNGRFVHGVLNIDSRGWASLS